MGAPEDWPRWAVLLPHVLAATGHFEPLAGPREQSGAPETSWLLDRAATYLQVHARLGEALPLAERALAITEAAYGPDHPNVGTGLNNLALIWQGLGQPERARPLAERALAITEAAYGPDHPTVRILRENLQSYEDH
jgi:tetratricopeptide (TPR) repeat protein